jgi:hypothetical protein
MGCEKLDGAIHYHSRRHGTAAELSARYGPVADVQIRDNDSIERWLTERYCLYTVHRGRVYRGEIHHLPWPSAGCPRGFHGQHNGTGCWYRTPEDRCAAAFCSQAGSSPMAAAPSLGLFGTDLNNAVYGGWGHGYNLDDAGFTGGQMFLKFAAPSRNMVLVVAGAVFLAAPSPIAIAQHSQAEGGYFALDYHGDTWTGTLTAVDHEKDAITLTYEHKGKSENFTGVFKHPLEVLDQYGQPTKTHLQLGDSLTAYYINGKKNKSVVTDNLIFKIKLLALPKHK